MIGPIIGIDLGTTNSLCGYFDGEKPVLIPNAHGSFLTPSVVGVLDDGQVLIGSAAKELRVTKPNQTASCFKRWMGMDHHLDLAGRKFSPVELSSLVLKSLRCLTSPQTGRPSVQLVRASAPPCARSSM